MIKIVFETVELIHIKFKLDLNSFVGFSNLEFGGNRLETDSWGCKVLNEPQNRALGLPLISHSWV